MYHTTNTATVSNHWMDDAEGQLLLGGYHVLGTKGFENSASKSVKERFNVSDSQRREKDF